MESGTVGPRQVPWKGHCSGKETETQSLVICQNQRSNFVLGQNQHVDLLTSNPYSFHSARRDLSSGVARVEEYRHLFPEKLVLWVSCIPSNIIFSRGKEMMS